MHLNEWLCTLQDAAQWLFPAAEGKQKKATSGSSTPKPLVQRFNQLFRRNKPHSSTGTTGLDPDTLALALQGQTQSVTVTSPPTVIQKAESAPSQHLPAMQDQVQNSPTSAHALVIGQANSVPVPSSFPSHPSGKQPNSGMVMQNAQVNSSRGPTPFIGSQQQRDMLLQVPRAVPATEGSLKSMQGPASAQSSDAKHSQAEELQGLGPLEQLQHSPGGLQKSPIEHSHEAAQSSLQAAAARPGLWQMPSSRGDRMQLPGDGPPQLSGPLQSVPPPPDTPWHPEQQQLHVSPAFCHPLGSLQSSSVSAVPGPHPVGMAQPPAQAYAAMLPGFGGVPYSNTGAGQGSAFPLLDAPHGARAASSDTYSSLSLHLAPPSHPRGNPEQPQMLPMTSSYADTAVPSLITPERVEQPRQYSTPNDHCIDISSWGGTEKQPQSSFAENPHLLQYQQAEQPMTGSSLSRAQSSASPGLAQQVPFYESSPQYTSVQAPSKASMPTKARTVFSSFLKVGSSKHNMAEDLETGQGRSSRAQGREEDCDAAAQPSGCSPKSALLQSARFPGSGQGQAQALSPEQAERRARGLVRTRVEPKVFFANERTFLQWLQISVLLMFTGLSLLGGSSVGGLGGGGGSEGACGQNGSTACKASKVSSGVLASA